MAERRYTAVLYIAIIVAGAATYGVYRVLEANRARSRIATRPVVVALQDMPEGSSIDRMAVGASQWPMQTVPAGAFGSVDSVVGRVTRVAVFKGEPIVPGRLAPTGTGPGLEVKISPGKRAMAVKINDVAGVSGLIQPNSRVDVLVTLRFPGSEDRQHQVTKLFMENMRVLSMGTQVQRGTDGKPINATTATLEVTPEEAERLALAANQGSIQLVLRGYGDPDSVDTKGATTRDVLAQLRVDPSAAEPQRPAPKPVRRVSTPSRSTPVPPPAVVAAPAPAKPDTVVVKVYRAGKLSQQKFEQDDPTSVSAVRPDSL
jgi:pilus assembly protein CpaB